MPRSKQLANAAGILAAGIAVLFVAFEGEARAGGAHVAELVRVGMAVLTTILASAYFTHRIVERAVAEDQEARPAVDEMHIARAAAKLVVDEMRLEIRAALDQSFRSGMVAGAERDATINGNSGGFPKLAHIRQGE
jgi:hypothetical protein